MSRIMHRFLGKPYPVAVGGEGPYVIDQTGKRYIDASSGAGVSNLGYSNQNVAGAIAAQAHKIPYVYNAFFATEIAEKYAEEVIGMCPEGLDYVFFGSGGSESMDGALKMALQYHLEMGEPQRINFISRHQSYHGCAVGSLSVSGNVIRRTAFEPFLPQTHFVSPCYQYRHQQQGESDTDYVARLAAELDEKINSLGPETVAAFIAEPIVAATAGCVPALPGYFREMRAVCDRHGVLFIADEIFTGAGRTGTWLALEADGVVADLVTVAKGLAAGFQPLSAILVSDKVYTVLKERKGYFMHGHTYNDHATACAAGYAVLQELKEQALFENVQKMGEKLKTALCDEFSEHPNVGDIRGKGLMLGMELVADRQTKKTFDPLSLVWLNVQVTALEKGLMVYPGCGTADGINGDHILIAPPFIVNDGHLDEIVSKLSDTLNAVQKQGYAMSL